MDSIIQKNKECCYLCGNTRNLQWHHCWHGTANRKIAEKYGLKVRLCAECHTMGARAVHRDSELDRHLMRESQRVAMIHYGWTTDEFIKHFGKNLL